ncbi:Sulfotransferase family protein [Posidoniimonas polymericola]|uniref:Sulfotransferase family protein n=1 Tax=Posidoniimonas polymericola TaxID=2528002 RepID=A0A5C5YS11_9BACT|nr:sulfotransferase family 2 domain-containing protein [Posidoniimonas polymericola]TWT77774.1 Sulfotransferase family protein [Posidoniimonas polymericola]
MPSTDSTVAPAKPSTPGVAPGSLLAFVHIEKCGGTTLIDTLRRTFCLNHIDVIPLDRTSMLFTRDDLQRARRLRPQLASVSGHSVRLHSDLDSQGDQIAYYTCLRDPIRRYLSEYYYFVERLGMQPGFPRWLDREDRHNFQTQAIAGAPNLVSAKAMVDTRFVEVGLLEEYDTFLSRLDSIAASASGQRLLPARGVLNPRRRQGGLPEPKELLEKHGDAIIAANALDIALVEHLKTSHRTITAAESPSAIASTSTSSPSRFPAWLSDHARLAVYRAYRNLVYKPYVGRLPRTHCLPTYHCTNVNPPVAPPNRRAA